MAETWGGKNWTKLDIGFVQFAILGVKLCPKKSRHVAVTARQTASAGEILTRSTTETWGEKNWTKLDIGFVQFAIWGVKLCPKKSRHVAEQRGRQRVQARY
jgi:hypothetical protein